MSYVGSSHHTCAKCLKVSTWPADEFPDQCWQEDDFGQICGSTEFLNRRVFVDIDGTGIREQFIMGK